MQIVIDIPEGNYKTICETKNLWETEPKNIIYAAIANGTPLPKGHGALKDFEKIYADLTEKEELATQRVIDTPTNSPCYMRYVAQLNERIAFKEMLYDVPTIIEADKEQKDNGFFDEIMNDESEDEETYEKIKEIIEKVKEQEE